MRRFLAPSSGLDKFFAAQFSAGYITNMSGFDLRQAHRSASSRSETMAGASKLALDFLVRRATMTSRQLPVPNFI
jgi:hypothetical protein